MTIANRSMEMMDKALFALDGKLYSKYNQKNCYLHIVLCGNNFCTLILQHVSRVKPDLRKKNEKKPVYISKQALLGQPPACMQVLSIYSSRGMNIFGNTVIDVCQEYLQRIYIQPLPHNSLLYNCPQQQQKQQLNLNVFSRSTKFSSSKSMFMQKKSCFPPKTAC